MGSRGTGRAQRGVQSRPSQEPQWQQGEAWGQEKPRSVALLLPHLMVLARSPHIAIRGTLVPWWLQHLKLQAWPGCLRGFAPVFCIMLALLLFLKKQVLKSLC